MASALALPAIPALPAADWLRSAIVIGCALALILADKALPI
ncbi:hypothetical protein OLX02_06065 [Novosphingobium sp. KCTC 2891]|nr:hypothetical protein [Novosphingobium sp. KCTC 2891]MCW1382383.1 hypothetical protein [Novosphingobium sp. KCTC 2891]